MILKVILTHADEGSIEIPEPDGWKDAEVVLKRDPELWTVAPYFEAPFNAYGEFRTWCLRVERIHGPDAIIIAKIRYSPEERGLQFYELFPDSDIEIAVGSFTETVGQELGHGLEYGFVLRSVWARFQQRFETPVDIQSPTDLDGNAVDVLAPILVPQTPQIVPMRHYDFVSQAASLYTDPASGKFIQGAGDRNELDEIGIYYPLFIAINPEIPVSNFDAEYAGEYTFNLRYELSMWFRLDLTPMPTGQVRTMQFSGGGHFVDYFLQVNDETPEIFTKTEFTPAVDKESTVYTLSSTKTLKVTDQVRIYATINQNFPTDSGEYGAPGLPIVASIIVWGDVNNDVTVFHAVDAFASTIDEHVNLDAISAIDGIPSGVTRATFVDFTGQTIFPETVAQGIQTHDLLASAIKRICGAEFYSEVLGSPETLARQYDYPGCFSRFMHYKGLHLRGYLLSEKSFFASVKDIWNGINPAHCLAMGFDKVDGVDVVRVWRRGELFDETRVSATLDNMKDISRSYDQEEFFNHVRIGYDKGLLQEISSIDDPQIFHDYADILKKIGKRIEIMSTMVGASLAFEIVRRFSKMKSADHQMDNDMFIQAVVLDGDNFRPELNEVFSDVTGLLNEETRYNKRITPARNLLNWLDYVSNCLQAYPGSTFKFTGGEGNYDMQAKMTPGDCGNEFGGNPLSEKQDIPISTNYMFWPIAYTIKGAISFGQWLQIISNMNAAIRVSQSTTGHMPFFTKTLTVGLHAGFMNLMAWPKRFFPLGIVQNNETEHENRTGRRFDDTFGPEFN